MTNHDQVPGPNRQGPDEPITRQAPIIPEIVEPEIVEPDVGQPDIETAGGRDGPENGSGTHFDNPPMELTVEDLIDQLEQVTKERDGHFDARARLQAEFDNYRKRIAHQNTERVERAAETLVGKLLPVLDACDAAIALSVAGAEPIAAQLVGVLEKEGLARINALDQIFDPEVHEAVIHEPGDAAEDGNGGPKVVDVLRAGYQWRSRVIRPAMVKVRG